MVAVRPRSPDCGRTAGGHGRPHLVLGVRSDAGQRVGPCAVLRRRCPVTEDGPYPSAASYPVLTDGARDEGWQLSFGVADPRLWGHLGRARAGGWVRLRVLLLSRGRSIQQRVSRHVVSAREPRENGCGWPVRLTSAVLGAVEPAAKSDAGAGQASGSVALSTQGRISTSSSPCRTALACRSRRGGGRWTCSTRGARASTSARRLQGVHPGPGDSGRAQREVRTFTCMTEDLGAAGLVGR